MRRRKQEGREEKGALQHHANLQKKREKLLRESLNEEILHKSINFFQTLVVRAAALKAN